MEPALLEFDGGHPVRFSARRFKGVGGEKVDWEVTYAGWREVSGIRLPDHIEVRWADEPGPWFRFEREGFAANVDVAPRIEQLRHLLGGTGARCPVAHRLVEELEIDTSSFAPRVGPAPGGVWIATLPLSR